MKNLVVIALLMFCVTGIAAPVISISDGDTLTVLEDRRQVKIRLANIDAPEKKQAFGERSRQSLAELCFQEDATPTRYRQSTATSALWLS